MGTKILENVRLRIEKRRPEGMALSEEGAVAIARAGKAGVLNPDAVTQISVPQPKTARPND